MFFMGALYLQRVLGYDALQTGLAFLPSTIVMGTLSLRYSERLIMRFGARTTLIPGLVLGVAGLLLFTRAPVDGSYVEHVLPVMLLLGAGAGISFPALMTLVDVGRHAERRRARVRPRQHHAAGRRRARARGARDALDDPDREPAAKPATRPLAALNGGYHLAYLVGAGLILAALVVALTVLQPERKAAEAVEAKQKRAPARRPKPAYEVS